MAGNLYELFCQRFPNDRSTPALEVPGRAPVSFAALEALSGRYAASLADLGATAGQRVAVQVAKSPEAVALTLACLRAGAVLLPLNPAYQADELAYFLTDAEPAVMVCQPDRQAELNKVVAATGLGTRIVTLGSDGDGSLPDMAAAADANFPTSARGGDDIAAILYSSGTTGRPKGVMLSHANLEANAVTLHRVWGWRKGDVLLHALPIFHTHGLFVAINCALLNGSTMIFLPRFEPEQVISLLPRATVFMGVPTFYTRLLASPNLTPEACASVRLFISGSAPLLEETFNGFHRRTGHTILERYGMTEGGMFTSNPLEGERKAGTVGPALPDVDLRITGEDGGILPAGEIGGIEVRGPNLFKGYWRLPEKTLAEFTVDGFFKTGDMGVIDEDGYVAIVGRAKDLIISGGFNVYPKEVEDVIDRLEGVVESAVVGMPHPDFGEAGLAVVVRAPGGPRLTEAALLAALKGKLANFKLPKRVAFAAELPRNAMGKVQKNELRQRYAALWAAG
jgi:malonyl-CoA/methylmalonyl-CoA synthetase